MASGSGEEVGVAFVRLVPSMRGFGPEAESALNDATNGPADAAGERAGGRFSGAFTAAMAGGAALAVGALVAGVGEALDQGKITAKLGAQLGATPAEAEKYGQIAGDLYAGAITTDFQQAADAIKATMGSGLLPPEATNAQIEGMSTKVADLANTFDQDLGGVTNAVSQMLRTGLASSADEAFDVLTVGFQSSANKADDLLDTFNEYGTQFRKAGLDGATAMGLLDQAIQAGARDSDVAADAIKEFSIRAVDGSKTSADGFKALGLNADDMAAKFAQGGKSASGALDTTLDRLRNIKDPVEQSQIAVGLFGTQAEDLGAALFAMDPSKAAKGIGDVGGAADKLGTSLHDNAGAEVEKFKRGLQQGFVEFLGNEVIPKLRDFFGFMKDNKGVVIGITTVILALGAAFAIASIGVWAMNSAMLANPMFWIIGGIVAGLVGLVILIVTYWDEIKAATMAAWDWVVDKVVWAKDGILSAIEWLSQLPGKVGGWFSKMKDWAVEKALGLVDWMAGLPGRLWDALSGLAGTLWDAASGAFKSLKDGAVNKVSGFIDWVSGIPQRAVQRIKDGLWRFYNAGVDMVVGIWDGMKSAGGWLWNKVSGFAEDFVLSPIKGFFDIGSPSKLMAKEVGQWIPAGIADGWKAGIPQLQNAAARTTSAAVNAGSAARYGAVAPAGATVVIDGTNMPRALEEWLRHNVRTIGGGSTDGWLGQGTG